MSALVPAFVRSLKKFNNKKTVSSAFLFAFNNSQKTIRFYHHSPKVFEPVNNNKGNNGNNRKGGFNPSISAREILIGIIVVSIAVSSYYSFKQTDRKLEYKEKVREERKEHKEKVREERKESINEMKGNVKNWLQERKEKKEQKRREKMGIVEETDEEDKKEE